MCISKQSAIEIAKEVVEAWKGSQFQNRIELIQSNESMNDLTATNPRSFYVGTLTVVMNTLNFGTSINDLQLSIEKNGTTTTVFNFGTVTTAPAGEGAQLVEAGLPEKNFFTFTLPLVVFDSILNPTFTKFNFIGYKFTY